MMRTLIIRPNLMLMLLLIIAMVNLPARAEIAFGTFENPKDQADGKIEDWYFSNGGEYKGAKGGMKLDDMTSHRGDGCLALTADFSGGGKYVAVRKKLNLSKSEKPEKITFYFKNTNLNYLLIRVIDETGQTFQHKINIKQAVDWQKLELTEMVTRPNWGGAKDGKWHGLIYEFGILIEKQAITEGNEAQLFIDDVYINGEAPAEPSADATQKKTEHTIAAVSNTPSKLPIPLGQFEDGTVNGWWVLRDGGGDEPRVSTQTPHSGQGCMQVPIDFGDRDWMSLICQLDQPVNVRELNFFARSNNLKRITLQMMTAGGQRYAKTIALTSEGWQAISLGDMPDMDASLGEKNAQLYGSYSLFKFAINSNDKINANAPATLWLDDVTIGVDALKGMVNVPGAAFVNQGPLSACLQLERTTPIYWGEQDKPQTAVFTMKNDSKQSAQNPAVILIDHQLRLISTLLPAGAMQIKPGEQVSKTLSLNLPAFGQYALVTTLGDQRIDAELAWLKAKSSPDPQSAFGVQTHFSHGPWGKSQFVGGSAGTLDIITAMGAGWVRDDAVANFKGETMIHPADNLWTFPSYARKRGLMPMIAHTDFLDDGKSPDDDASIARFAKRAVQVVDYYGKDATVYEVWNEPTIQPGWRRTPDAVQYTNLLKATYTAIKQAHPQTFVLGVCSAGTDFAYIETVLKNGGGKFMDGISVHPYHGVAPELSANREQQAPPTWMGTGDNITFTNRILAVKKLLEKYGCPNVEVWGTEMGYNNKDVTQEWSQTKWLIRQYLIGMSIPYLKHQFTYNFMDQGYNAPDSNKMTFGLLRANGMPEPHFVAYNTMTRMLNGKKFDSKLDLGDGIYAYRFVNRDNGNDPVLALWCVDDGVTLGLKTSQSSIMAYDLMGNEHVIHPVGSTFTMAVTGEVTFLKNVSDVSITKPQIEITAPARCTSEDTLMATVNFTQGFKPDNIKAIAPEGWQGATVDGNKLSYEPTATLGSGTYVLAIEADGMTAATSVQLANSIYLTTTLTPEGFDVAINNPFPYERKMRLRVAAGDARMQERPVIAANATQTLHFPVNSQSNDAWLCQPVRLNPQITDGRRGHILMTEDSSDTLLAGQTPLYAQSSAGIDGNLREWQRYKPCLLDGKALSAKLGKTLSWEGSDDLSAKFWLGDDGSNLLLAISVTDNQFTQGAPVAQMWQGDSVQFALYHAGVRQEYTLGVDASDKLQVYQQAPEKRAITSLIQTAVKTTGTQRTMEIAIPWKLLNIDAKSNDLPRFALLVNDNDARDSDKDNLLRNRKSFLQWFEGIGGHAKMPQRYSYLVRQSH
jgi:hypothetical protein